MHPSTGRALAVGAVSIGVQVAMGLMSGNLNFMDAATNGGVLALSSWSSDSVHELLNMPPSMVTSAAATGAIYSASKALLKGEEFSVRDFVTAATIDAASDKLALTF